MIVHREGISQSLVRWVARAHEANPVRRGYRVGSRELAARVVDPDFWYGRYPHTFLERRPPQRSEEESTLPRVIWCFWVGDNPLTPARERGLASIRALNPDLQVELVTPDRLPGFVLPRHPLHPGYEHLSYNHRSDYLRAYFLHHYGGGYADIKPLVAPWGPAFERLAASECWLLGPPLAKAAWAGNPSGRLEAHLRRYYRLLPSGTMALAKSRTLITSEWLREIERRLDYYLPALQESPGGVWGQEPSYPIDWMALQGNIFQPLCLKYRDHVLLDPTLSWDLKARYR